MKLAVMQPYLFPHIGYFQLLHAVEKFIYYDDVNFIKHGWINRNKILSNNAGYFFSVPIKNISSYRKISATEIAQGPFLVWRKKFLRTLKQSYTKAPFFSDVYPRICDVFMEDHKYISRFCISSIEMVIDYLELNLDTGLSSERHAVSAELDRTERLISIANFEGCDTYINPIGGSAIYSETDFLARGIKLVFLKTNAISYPQMNNVFVPGLSIIDVLMFNSRKNVMNLLKSYALI